MSAVRGIIVALLVCAAALYAYRDEAIQRFHEPPAAVVDSITPQPQPPAPAPVALVAAANLSETAPIPQPTPTPAVAVTEAPPENQDEAENDMAIGPAVTLWIDENVIHELESNSDRLRDVIYTRPTNAGWKVRVLRPDGLVARAGLHDGDFVSYQGLNTQYEKSGTPELADRVAALFDSMRR